MGNEPFTKLGLKTESGNIYILQCSKELDVLLSAKQGVQLKLQYNGVRSTPEGTIVTITAIE
jgi:hypothetical protein